MLERMSTRARIGLSAAVTGLALAAAGGSVGGRESFNPCSGALRGSFNVVRGSAGAGHISYKLVLRNASRRGCFVTGVPTVTLLDRKGRSLPTDATFAGHPGMLTAVVVPLPPGKAAHLLARFSPDVRGRGEQVRGACERTAHKLRVTTSGGGNAVAPISPPTPVCERGSMQLTVLTAGG
jgi:Domain of unknown function (DUF4232)